MTTEVMRIAKVRRMARTGEARAMREAALISLRELADEIGVHHVTLARWEAGDDAPRAANALRWEAALRQLRRSAS